MKEKIIEIMKNARINDTGICDFSILQDKLLPCRALSRIPNGAKSVIICAFPYKVHDSAPKNISRYAAVPDYHPIVLEYLKVAAEKLKEEFPQNLFVPFCDNSPIPEVLCAAFAGLGVKGDNGLLLTEKYGSWVFLGEIVTDLEIESDNNYRECFHCGICLKKCPKERFKTDCLSAVSQKKKDLSDEEKHALKQNNILWGCDICAEYCPFNENTAISPLKEFALGYKDSYSFGEDITSRAFAWRGEAVIRRNFENLYRITEEISSFETQLNEKSDKK